MGSIHELLGMRVYLVWPTRHVGPGAWDRCSSVSLRALLVDALYAARDDDAFPPHLQALALLGRSVSDDADAVATKVHDALLDPERACCVLDKLMDLDDDLADAVRAHMKITRARSASAYTDALFSERAARLRACAESILALMARADTLPTDHAKHAAHNAKVAQRVRALVSSGGGRGGDTMHHASAAESAIRDALVSSNIDRAAPYVPSEPDARAERAAWAAIAHTICRWPSAQHACCETFVLEYAKNEASPAEAPMSLCAIKFLPTTRKGDAPRASVFDTCPLLDLDAVEPTGDEDDGTKQL
jgi:hypothetical protein